MNRIMRWMGVLGMVLAAGCGPQEAQVVEPGAMDATEVAVWVDQAGITRAQIQHEAMRLFSQAPKNIPPEQMERLQLQLLGRAVDNLVTRQLVKAEMERSGILISRDEIETGKRDLERGLGEGNSLTMLLAKVNLTMEELEANLVLDLFKNKVLKERVQAAVDAVTEETAREYYDENPERFTVPAGRQVSHILIRARPDDDEAVRADARARAEGVRKALLEGADFAGLAREVSQCMSRTRGGMLGVVPRGREAPAFEEAVYSQEFGAIGEVVESPVGYHVILVTGEQEEQLVPFDEIKERLITQLKSEAQQEVNAAYILELREKATIKLDDQFKAAADEADNAMDDAPGDELVPDAAAPAVTAP